MADPGTRQITNDIRFAVQQNVTGKVDNLHHEHDRSWFIIEHSTGHYTVEVSRREGHGAS